MSDLIRRQDAIDAIKTWGLIDGLSEGEAIEILADEEKLPSVQPEPLTVNFAREMDRETIERLKDGMKNAPVLIMAVNDSVQPDRKTSEWLHEYLQTAVDFGIITETQASRLIDMIDDSEDNT